MNCLKRKITRTQRAHIPSQDLILNYDIRGGKILKNSKLLISRESDLIRSSNINPTQITRKLLERKPGTDYSEGKSNSL